MVLIVGLRFIFDRLIDSSSFCPHLTDSTQIPSEAQCGLGVKDDESYKESRKENTEGHKLPRNTKKKEKRKEGGPQALGV